MRLTRATSAPYLPHWLPVASVFMLPDESAAASSVVIWLTLAGLPLRYAPQPRSAKLNSPYTGALDTPSTISPRRIRAICVENMGYSRTKALVPSIGSTSHRFSAFASRDPVSSPWNPYEGKRASRISRIAISQRTSASVTGDLSALMRTSRLRWYMARTMAAACSAASSAACSSEVGFMLSILPSYAQWLMRICYVHINLVLPSHPGFGVSSDGQPAQQDLYAHRR